MTAIFERWLNGEIDAGTALDTLCMELEGIDHELSILQVQKDEAREELAHIVRTIGGRASVTGFGELSWQEPRDLASYDARALDRLVRDWSEQGGLHAELAEQLGLFRKASQRRGHLLIRREQFDDPALVPEPLTETPALDEPIA